MGTTSRNNKHVKLPAKKRKTNPGKADKGKGKANEIEDPDMYAKW